MNGEIDMVARKVSIAELEKVYHKLNEIKNEG